MEERPHAVVEVHNIFMIDGGAFLLGTLIAAVTFLTKQNIHEHIFECILLLGLSSTYLVLGWGFYNGKRWAYKPTWWLAKIDMLASAGGLSKKIKQAEVYHWFGFEKKPGEK
jgi:UDP-N-acetylmuramyl pentapeptide phosphotransferase/UDP-N-acetylglucosamine-1-phosphate transferase